VSYQSYGDFPATLAHEIGHYINRMLDGRLGFELLYAVSPVTRTMRRVARFNEYFYQNKDEYYAAVWSRYLCGREKRTLLRYLEKPLRDLRTNDPVKAQLIEDYRAARLIANRNPGC
jgi:hypothetical protein